VRYKNYAGVGYQYGAGVTKDLVEALRLYKLAAEQGNADAQVNLGEWHLAFAPFNVMW
jgi:TPR repeat protein